jgi:signal transduction histidine kinase
MMPLCPEPAMMRELQQRARFDALRRRAFDDMGQCAARWKLAWILPFNGIVVGFLVARGEPWDRALIQAGAVMLVAGSLIGPTLTKRVPVKVGCFLCGIVSYFTLISTTGGLGSPLLFLCAPFLGAMPFTLREPPWLRRLGFGLFVMGFAALALLSDTPVGALVGPLARSGPWASREFVCIALLATLFAMLGLYRIGSSVTRGYERAALELAERRDQLCHENEDRMRAFEGIAARLAHEVKNPLAAIKGLSAHMARNANDPKTAERLAIVAGEADRLQSIVESFLSFSRGLDELSLAPVHPFEVARELSVLLETRAEEAGVRLAVAGDANVVVEADGRRLRQALLNLVVNAIQASPRDAVVHVGVERECEGVRITVRDDGVGMTPEVLERIRKPYFTTKEGGTGLGVAVARGLVEQHGGRLEFKSVAGKGTTVGIVLPTKAKCSARLPNPVRAIRRETTEAEKPEPAIAGAR